MESAIDNRGFVEVILTPRAHSEPMLTRMDFDAADKPLLGVERGAAMIGFASIPQVALCGADRSHDSFPRSPQGIGFGS